MPWSGPEVEYAAELRYYYPTLQITLVGGNRGVCPSMCPGARKYIKNHLDKNNITTFRSSGCFRFGRLTHFMLACGTAGSFVCRFDG